MIRLPNTRVQLILAWRTPARITDPFRWGNKTMNKSEIKKLFGVLEERVLAGERKADIYAAYLDEADATRCAKVLAQIPTPSRRTQFRVLNWILVADLGILALIKLFVVTLFVLTQIPKGFVLIFIAPLINIWIMWMVARFRAIGYLLVIAFGLTGLSKVIEGFQKSVDAVDMTLNSVSLLCVVSAMLIAGILMRKLLPKTSFLLRAKTDNTGRPQFEE